MSKFSSLLCMALLIQSSIALAAVSRQGPYIGAYLGDAFGSNDASTDVGAMNSTSYFANASDINAVNHAGTWTDNPNMAIGGIQLGHDWVWKQMVYGVVVDFGSLMLDSTEEKSSAYAGNADTFTIKTSMNTDWLFTLRGKLGYQTSWHWPGFVYLSGGMAMTNVEVENAFNDTSSLAGMGGKNTAQNQIGWTAGLGIEIASYNYVSIGLEYLFVQVPSVESTTTISNTQAGFGIPAGSLTSGFTTTGDFQANLLKVIVNYRFQE